MKFNISSLPLGVREHSLVVESQDIGLDERFLGDVTVLARFEKTERIIKLNVYARSQANLICDRCAEQFVKELKTSFRIYYLLHAEDAARYPEEEAVIIPSEYAVIDISDDVRQYVLLTIPFKILCKEDCKGLCPECGVNRNFKTCSCDMSVVDPRWEPLKKLFHSN